MKFREKTVAVPSLEQSKTRSEEPGRVEIIPSHGKGAELCDLYILIQPKSFHDPTI